MQSSAGFMRGTLKSWKQRPSRASSPTPLLIWSLQISKNSLNLLMILFNMIIDVIKISAEIFFRRFQNMAHRNSNKFLDRLLYRLVFQPHQPERVNSRVFEDHQHSENSFLANKNSEKFNSATMWNFQKVQLLVIIFLEKLVLEHFLKTEGGSLIITWAIVALVILLLVLSKTSKSW